MDADEITSRSFVNQALLYDELPSTSDAALARGRERDVTLPLLVWARRQTAGRGRGSNSWWWSEGALTFSVLLAPCEYGIRTQQWPQMSLAAALAVCRGLEATSPAVACRIKWPNDVYCRGRKICGILVEGVSNVGATANVVIGVGVNVNNSLRQAPVELAQSATSLREETGGNHDVSEVLTHILHELRASLVSLGGGDPSLPAAWQRRCLLTGQTIEVDAGREQIAGVCRGIAEDGALRVVTAGGERRLLSGSVTRFHE